MEKVSIIIPTRSLKRKKNIRHFYRPISSLPDLIGDIEKNVSVDCKTIVVCNGLGDRDLLEFVKGDAIHRYCVNSCNVGVSRAWNMGRQLAQGNFLLFINDDVRIGIGAVEKLCGVLEADPEIGIVGPQGSMWKNYEHQRFAGQEEEEDSDVISGFCFMLKAEIYDLVGGFDINYSPAGFEEIDFCYTVRRSGFRCRVVPGLDFKTEPCHGISAINTDIPYFETSINTKELHNRNKNYFRKKWC